MLLAAASVLVQVFVLFFLYALWQRDTTDEVFSIERMISYVYLFVILANVGLSYLTFKPENLKKQVCAALFFVNYLITNICMAILIAAVISVEYIKSIEVLVAGAGILLVAGRFWVSSKFFGLTDMFVPDETNKQRISYF